MNHTSHHPPTNISFSLKTGEAPQVKEKEIYIIVERGTLGIQIQKIEAPNGAELDEKTGEVKLEVTVEDLNKPTETGAWPALLLVPMDSVNDFDLAPYTKVLTPESLGHGLFKFRINIAPKKNFVSTSQKIYDRRETR